NYWILNYLLNSVFWLPPDIVGLSKLKFLNLDYINNIDASILLESMGALPSLKTLSYQYILKTVEVPQEFYNLTSLEELLLDLTYLPKSVLQKLGALPSLKILSLNRCKLNGTLPDLYLSGNDLVGELPPCMRNFVISSETRTAEYPYFLQFQYDLRLLDLSENNFGGQFPYGMVENNTRLKRLFLKNNALEGPLHLQYPVSNLSTIDISSNYMDGQTLKTICSIFPNLVNLMISDNNLTSGIPSCFDNMTNLAYLDMSNNKLSSALFELLPSFGSSLWFLKLSNNNLEGRISPTFFNRTIILYLYLDNNNFFGHFPNSLPTEFSPALFDISNNHFSGMLPRRLGNLSFLLEIDFSKNQF
ncbi:hypothetical protein Tsubulata_041059, partial [Turnera subulata]